MWPRDTPLQGWWLLQQECLRAGARPWRGWVKNYRVGWGGAVTLEHPQIAPLWPRHPAIFSLFSSSASSLHIGISERKLVESYIDRAELRWVPPVWEQVSNVKMCCCRCDKVSLPYFYCWWLHFQPIKIYNNFSNLQNNPIWAIPRDGGEKRHLTPNTYYNFCILVQTMKVKTFLMESIEIDFILELRPLRII